MDFKKSDIPALDFIINQILKPGLKVFSNDLVEAGYIKDKYPDAEHEFERLLAIIEPIGCAKVNPRTNEDSGANVEANGHTAKFKFEGNFDSFFEKLHKEDELTKQEQANDKLEYKLNKLKYKTFWPLLAVSIFSVFFSIYKYSENLKLQEKLKNIEQEQVENITKLKELQILLLRHNNQDSSFRENVDKKIKFLLSSHTDKDTLEKQ